MGDDNFAVGYVFLLRIDREELGYFSKIEGLSATYETLDIKEGGQNGYVHKLPGRVSYENLKLTRGVTSSSARLSAWFTEFQTALQSGGSLARVEGAVAAFDSNLEVVATWTLAEVCPMRYSGPRFDAGQPGVLEETIELAYNGFRFEPGTPTALSKARSAVSLAKSPPRPDMPAVGRP